MPNHISYFSRSGFRRLLEENGFRVLEYRISNRYNGSMEIAAARAE